MNSRSGEKAGIEGLGQSSGQVDERENSFKATTARSVEALDQRVAELELPMFKNLSRRVGRLEERAPMERLALGATALIVLLFAGSLLAGFHLLLEFLRRRPGGDSVAVESSSLAEGLALLSRGPVNLAPVEVRPSAVAWAVGMSFVAFAVALAVVALGASVAVSRIGAEER